MSIKQNVPSWASAIAFSIGRDSYERKQLAKNLVQLFKEKYSFQEQCSCCGRHLVVYGSMKIGMGPVCSGNKCQCKVKRLWTRSEILELLSNG